MPICCKKTILIIIYLPVFCFIWGACTTETGSSGEVSAYSDIRLLAEYSLDFGGPSGLSYDTITNSLWAVSDRPNGGIYNITTKGNIINHIEFESDDLEGIIFDSESNSFWVVEERLRQILNISKSGDLLQKVQLHIDGESANDGPEGITKNPNNGHFYIVNEQNPRQLHELNPAMEIINTTNITFKGIFKMDDLSGISYNQQENNLWIVSDSSEKIVVLDLNGRPVKAFDIGVFDAEAIALNSSERIVFILSDSNKKLFVFNY